MSLRATEGSVAIFTGRSLRDPLLRLLAGSGGHYTHRMIASSLSKNLKAPRNDTGKDSFLSDKKFTLLKVLTKMF